MMAATTMMMTKAYFRYCFNNPDFTAPILPKKKAMTGSWNTNPMTSVRVVNVLM